MRLSNGNLFGKSQVGGNEDPSMVLQKIGSPDWRPKNWAQKPLWQEGVPTWPPESHRRKRAYVTEVGTKRREVFRRLKPIQTNLSGPTGLVAWEGSVKVRKEGRM